ncbi:MAG: SCO family protein [Planctomycetes bacterium]|nr:SCO family protein [Planctomycetota bacterium]
MTIWLDSAMYFKSISLMLATALCACVCAAQSTAQLEYELRGVEVIENIGGEIPLDLTFTDDDNERVTLGQYFKQGRPVLISLNYTNCPRLCSYQLTDMAKALKDMGWTPGNEFVFLTISIDPSEDFKTSKKSKLRYLGLVGKAEADKGWHFLTTTENEDILKLADALGYHYKLDPETGEYRHKAAMFIVNGDGKISHYLRNIGYVPEDVQAKLQASANGEFGQPDQDGQGFGLNCFAFQYTDNMSRAFTMMKIGGVGVLVFLFSFLGYWWYRELKKHREEQAHDEQVQAEAT